MQIVDIDEIQPTPTFHDKKCKIFLYTLKIFLQFFSIIVTLLALYEYGYFIAFVILLITFLLMGIIRSKLRNSSIPLGQREYKYTDKEIASWYISKYIC